MAQQTAADDPRSDNMKIKMAKHFEEYEGEYRDGSFSKVVYEDDEIIIASDGSGHELNEWASDFDVSRDELSEFFHSVARSRYSNDDIGDEWAVRDPIVFDKFE